MQAPHPNKDLKISEAAAIAGVSTKTLRRYAANGLVTCYRLPGKDGRPGHRRFRLAAERSEVALSPEAVA